MLVDLSHTIEHGMTTYPGLPAPLICDYLSREASRSRYTGGATFQIGRIDMVSNTGTYLDTPFHRYEDGIDLAGLPLESVAGLPALRLTFFPGPDRAITRARLDRAIGTREIRGVAVLLHTGWDAHWRSERYGSPNPFLSSDGAELLLERGAALAGIDSVNIDDMQDLSRPVHTLLLRQGVPIVEHMTNLGRMAENGMRFYAVPPKVMGMGTFPVRAFATASGPPRES
ncbi:MAG TPA: cyclase family protein [Gemmatimonadales bacterium]|nr:cyclase family protein [Gemmatimonadales bacterium]